MALCEILPDYKEMLEESRITSTDHQDSSTPSSMPNAAGAPASSNALPTDAELEVFKRLGMVDKKIYELTNTSRLTCVSPYSIFSEYVRRHCIPEREINAKMVPLGRNRHRFELSLGDLHSKVSVHHCSLTLIIIYSHSINKICVFHALFWCMGRLGSEHTAALVPSIGDRARDVRIRGEHAYHGFATFV